jgi:uncharacterized protein (TIGR02246 family)
MNSLRIVFALLLLAASLPAQEAVPNQDDAELGKILQLEHRDAEAARINDVDALVSLWTDDGVLLMPGADPVVGKPSIRKLLETQKQQSGGIQTVSYEENWTERHTIGNAAWEWGSISVSIQLPDGRRASQKAFMLRILSRQPDGTWKFARAIGTPAPKKPS